jgi:hypothetical protein
MVLLVKWLIQISSPIVFDAGVKSVDISLENQVVRVLGSTTVKDMTAALAESGRKARLIGQGLPESKFLLVDFL